MVAYMSPLCLYVLRMVGEKQTKAKEGKKIMGINESIYFFSLFYTIFGYKFISSICKCINHTFYF